jgi:hypothetical protein
MLDVDSAEIGEHADQGVLGEAPEIMRLIVVGKQERDVDHCPPSRLERAMDALDRGVEVANVLEHIGTEDHVELAVEVHRSRVHDQVAVFRHDVGLDELVGGVEDGSHRVGVGAPIESPTAELEHLGFMNRFSEQRHLPSHPPAASE